MKVEIVTLPVFVFDQNELFVNFREILNRFHIFAQEGVIELCVFNQDISYMYQ